VNYAEAFSNPKLGQKLLLAIAREASRPREYFLMEFCGGHTHALCKHGLPQLLPPNVHMVHGPGCPVCVLPMGRINQALELLASTQVVLCSFGDMSRVPGSQGQSLLGARAQGADVRMVLGPSQALKLAEAMPQREVVFFAVGFETTTPPTALSLLEAKQKGLHNFSVLCNHVCTPPAMRGVLEALQSTTSRVDAMLAPGHVAAITGTVPFEAVSKAFGLPVCVTGFEVVDLLSAILRLLRQLNRKEARLENAYARATTREGNLKAQQCMQEVFAVSPSFEWRGLGRLPESALCIAKAHAAWDAEAKWQLPHRPVGDHPGCCCAEVLRGQKKPSACGLFAKACTPDAPMGACMVSPEGACAAYYAYAF
jgi:hydrogenase expression/formation protein HypD